MTADIQSYHDLGQYFRECRESMRIPLDLAARKMRLRTKYLRAIEDGNMVGMPGLVYARGYVLRYAEFLNLKEDNIAQTFDLLSGKVKKDNFFMPEPTRLQNLPSAQVIGASLAMMLVIYTAWYLFDTAPQSRAPVSSIPERYMHMVQSRSANIDWSKNPLTCLVPMRTDVPPLCLARHPRIHSSTLLSPAAGFSSQLVIRHE